jgi:dTDP-glucose 4,6-dehydratase
MAVIDAICATVDAAFAADPALARRFPDAPAARGEPSVALKTYVTDRLGHDRRYAIDERKARAELGYAPSRDFASGFTETLAWYLGTDYRRYGAGRRVPGRSFCSTRGTRCTV